ncbi:MAG TPA: hypothetical protein VHO25_21515 [Polyangiaceae bacterium]|nr:hypothetical protein [Polyangiaceae bacterium]
MKFSTEARSAKAQSYIDLISGGFIRAYNGTKPTNPNTALAGNTLLGSIPLNTPAGTVTNGVATLDVTGATDASADAAGTPTFCRIFKSDGTTAVIDLTAGVGSGECNFTAIIAAGAGLPLSSCVFTEPVGSDP